MSNAKKVLFYIVLIILIIVIVLFCYRYSHEIIQILSPFFIGAVIAYAIYPIVIRFERKGIKRSIAIIIVYIFATFTIIFLGLYIMPQVINNARELINTLPDITNKYKDMFNSIILKIKSSKWPPEVKNMIFNEISNGTGYIQNFASQTFKKSLSVVTSTVVILVNIILSMIIAYYFLKDVEFFKRSVLMLVPKRFRNEMINTGREINNIVSHFIQGQLWTALIVGSMETLGLYIVHVRYPFVLGLIGGIANIIPYFGPILGAIPAVSLALIESPTKALLATIVFVLVQQIDNAFISPKIIEGKLGLHPVSTIIAVLIGGEFFGIIGMLVAVPIMAILKVILKRTIDLFV